MTSTSRELKWNITNVIDEVFERSGTFSLSSADGLARQNIATTYTVSPVDCWNR